MATNAKPFVWYELTTTDTSAALAFYGKVFGWDARDSGLPGMKYLLLSAASVELGGMLSLADAGCDTATPPFWLGYIGSDDVDKDAARVKAAGGKVHSEPADIPGIGRFAVVADPHGASFVLFRGAATDQMPAAAPAYTPGHIGWRELHAGNGEEAFAFYSEMFGWTKAETMDMGPLGIYQIYAINGESAGGMMTKMADTPGADVALLRVRGRHRCGRDAREGRRRQAAPGNARGAGRHVDLAVPRSPGRDVRDGGPAALTRTIVRPGARPPRAPAGHPRAPSTCAGASPTNGRAASPSRGSRRCAPSRSS